MAKRDVLDEMIITRVNKDQKDWVRTRAKKMSLSESDIIRLFIVDAMSTEKAGDILASAVKGANHG